MVVEIPKADFCFIHLSDIHFRKGHSCDPHDEDALLRHEIERDLRQLKSELPRLDAIVVTGDIAFAGKREEYELASNWLKRIGELVGCNSGSILVTPGNHDIDRSKLPDGCEIRALHENVRGANSEQRKQRLAEILRDARKSSQLFEPLEEYNRFAEQYGCAVSPSHPFWERDFQLPDKTVLRLRGITTTFISGPLDDIDTHRMMYGTAQVTVLRDDNMRVVVLGHHPPSWTYEGQDADQAFSIMSIIQAYGHRHQQWHAQNGNSVRIIAGAVHPDRREPQWGPRYAAICINKLGTGQLEIRIFPRRWSGEVMAFIPDINREREDFRRYLVN